MGGEHDENKTPRQTARHTCFLIGLSKIAGAVSCVRVVINGILLAETNSAIADALKHSGERRNNF